MTMAHDDTDMCRDGHVEIWYHHNDRNTTCPLCSNLVIGHLKILQAHVQELMDRWEEVRDGIHTR